MLVSMFWCGLESRARAGHGASHNMQDSECPLDLEGSKSSICKFLSYFRAPGLFRTQIRNLIFSDMFHSFHGIGQIFCIFIQIMFFGSPVG